MATNLLAQLQIAGVYTSYPLFESEGVELQLGPDVDEKWRANTATMRWNNASGDLDPSLPTSSLYGQIMQNLPVRFRLGPTPSTVFVGYASSWKPDQDPEFNGTVGRRWVDMEAAGTYRRVGRWEDPINSAMYTWGTGINGLLGMWPLEGGGTDTTQLSEVSGAPGAAAGSVAGSVTFSGDDGPAGSAKVITIGTGGAMSARFARVTTSGYEVLFHFKLDAVPAGATYEPLLGFNLSNGNRFEWQVSSAGFQLITYDPFGATKGSITSLTLVDVTKWIRCRVKATVSAGTVTIEPAWYQQDQDTIWGVTYTYSDTGTGALLNWQVAQNDWNNGAAYALVLGTSDTTVDLTGVVEFNGFAGEGAASRAARLLAQQGISMTLIGSFGDSPPMGRQPIANLETCLDQCRVTDGGLMYDSPTFGIPNFRTRRNIQDQAAAVLALVVGTHLVPPFKPIIGDQLIVNDATATNVNGVTARRIVTSGPLSVADPPAGVSRYKRNVDVSYDNDDFVADRASWEVSKGTVRRWYQQVTIDFLKTPSLYDTIIGLRPGDLITLAGAEPDTVRLHLRYVTWEISNGPVRATLTMVPADAWAPGKYDATNTRRDASFSTTSGSTTTTGVTLAVTNPVLADCWSTTAGYDIKVTGERMTVTAASAPAGTGPYTQNLTVTRSVNGVVKAHVANESVSLADPVRYTPAY